MGEDVLAGGGRRQVKVTMSQQLPLCLRSDVLYRPSQSSASSPFSSQPLRTDFRNSGLSYKQDAALTRGSHLESRVVLPDSNYFWKLDPDPH
jgi:hypothetical protein